MDSLKVRPLPTDSLKVHLLHTEVPLQVGSQETTCSQFLRILQPMALMELHLIQPNKIEMPTLEDRWEDQWDHTWDNLVHKWE